MTSTDRQSKVSAPEKLATPCESDTAAAFAPDSAGTEQAAESAPSPVRDAGPEEMRDDHEDWDDVDQQADESFPASDPPGNY